MLAHVGFLLLHSDIFFTLYRFFNWLLVTPMELYTWLWVGSVSILLLLFSCGHWRNFLFIIRSKRFRYLLNNECLKREVSLKAPLSNSNKVKLNAEYISRKQRNWLKLSEELMSEKGDNLTGITVLIHLMLMKCKKNGREKYINDKNILQVIIKCSKQGDLFEKLPWRGICYFVKEKANDKTLGKDWDYKLLLHIDPRPNRQSRDETGASGRRYRNITLTRRRGWIRCRCVRPQEAGGCQTII